MRAEGRLFKAETKTLQMSLDRDTCLYNQGTSKEIIC